MQGMYKHLLLHAIDYLKYIRQPGRLPPTENGPSGAQKKIWTGFIPHAQGSPGTQWNLERLTKPCHRLTGVARLA